MILRRNWLPVLEQAGTVGADRAGGHPARLFWRLSFGIAARQGRHRDQILPFWLTLDEHSKKVVICRRRKLRFFAAGVSILWMSERGQSPVTIVNVGYRSTNYWVVSAGRSRLLVDLGWPGTMGLMRANLRRMGVPLAEIRYGLATHYHIDHAGLAQELKLAGVPLLVLAVQVDAIPAMKRWTKPQDQYVAITTHDNVVISFAESRPLLLAMGIAGEIVHTPGHSEDSVSLVLDDGAALRGI